MLTNENVNMMELCFNNGKKYAKEKIVSELMDYQTRVCDECHAHMVEIIKMLEDI